MLKELNATLGALCSMTVTTAKAVDDGAKVLRIKGVAAKQVAALEAAAAIAAAKKDCDEQQLQAACELLDLVED